MSKLVIIEVMHCDIFVWRQMVVNNCQGNVCSFEEKTKLYSSFRKSIGKYKLRINQPSTSQKQRFQCLSVFGHLDSHNVYYVKLNSMYKLRLCEPY